MSSTRTEGTVSRTTSVMVLVRPLPLVITTSKLSSVTTRDNVGTTYDRLVRRTGRGVRHIVGLSWGLSRLALGYSVPVITLGSPLQPGSA